MSRIVFLSIVALLGLGAALECIPLWVSERDASYPLTVNVESTAGRIRAVSTQTFLSRREAEDYSLRLGTTTPYEDKPLTVKVPVACEDSPFGREVKRLPHRYLAVVAEVGAGKAFGKYMEIPEGREVRVTLP